VFPDLTQVANSLSDIKRDQDDDDGGRQTRSDNPSPELKETRPMSRDSPRKSTFASRASFYKESSTSETSLFEEPSTSPGSFKLYRDVLRMLKSDKTFKFDYRLTAQEGDVMSRLWADAGVRQCFQHSKSYQLIDSAEYVLDNLDKITDDSYTPTADVSALSFATEDLELTGFELLGNSRGLMPQRTKQMRTINIKAECHF